MYYLLKNVTVLEFGAVVMGPYAGQMLADLGATVIKIEPLTGDISRASHPMVDGSGTLFLNNNRNKKALALDLKAPRSRDIVRRLVSRSTVLLHNMRVEAAARAGIDFETAAAINPDIVYCAAIGFGQGGRYRNRPAFDDVVQAASGLAGLSLEVSSDPAYVPTILADKLGALHAVQGILAALYAKASGHAGAIHVEVPMFEAAVATLLNEHLSGATAGPVSDIGYPRLFYPDRRPYRTRDGWIAALPYTGPQWQAFLHEIGRSDLIQTEWFRDPAQRQAHLPELYLVVADAMPSRTTAEWIERLTLLDIPCSTVASLADLPDDPHLADIGFFTPGPLYPPSIKRTIGHPITFGSVDRHDDRPPPALGEHSRAVLRGCGYDDAEIEALLFEGVVSDPVGPA
ncbi:CaiB/BaiF CoA transferase family protein [Sphingomonas oryzagri]|jgi:crotonobetainyl-CoA:carnitine CoA-transferase CaiB-like acyl-CoA transferase|uniref:CoA transferase n=1 Tax=Sphingomonas oryzagri TaxID=3042314 RepID=A0ABT6MXD7_9SPHN|nr:CoA transferase [Sphingomonas oryzagri]MDH7637704.1 CoA transferase [Sphingomonas oryzagri]